MIDTPEKTKGKRARLSRKRKFMAAKAKPVPTVKRARKPISEKAIFVTLSARDQALVERYGTIAIPANDELYEIFRYVLGVFEGDVEKTDWRYLYVNGG